MRERKEEGVGLAGTSECYGEQVRAKERRMRGLTSPAAPHGPHTLITLPALNHQGGVIKGKGVRERKGKGWA